MTLEAVHAHVEALRIRQWVKSVFVFAPLVFSNSFRSVHAVGKTTLVALAFCLSASAVYLLNDICDLKRDVNHPAKKNRPIARGAVKRGTAGLIAILVVIPGIAVPAIISPQISLFMAAYVVMNALYSRFLKGEAFLDVMVIAAGFVLRVVAGGRAIGVEVSPWMILTTFFLALFLGFGKRREEFVSLSGEHTQRDVLQYYSVPLLNCLVVVTAALTIITYSLYTLSSATFLTMGVDGLVWTVPLVVFGIFRYLGLIFNDNGGGDPAEVLLHDRLLIADVVIWVGLVMALLVGAQPGGPV